MSSSPVGVCQRETAGGHEYAVGEHFTFNLDETGDSSGDAGSNLEPRVRSSGRGKLESSDGRDRNRSWSRVGTCRRDATSLRDHFDEDHGGHDRSARKMSLKEEVQRRVRMRRLRAGAGHDVGHFVDETHGRLLRKLREPIHRRLRYTFRFVNAIVEQFDRLWRDEPSRPLIHLPSLARTLNANDLQHDRKVYTATLTSAGIGDGHLIISVAGNRTGFLALLLAAWSLDASVMPVDEDIRDEGLEELAARFGAAAVVRVRDRAVPESRALDDVLAIEFRRPDAWRRHSGLSLLKLTSGSSGLPKAVGAPSAVMISDTEHIIESLGIRP